MKYYRQDCSIVLSNGACLRVGGVCGSHPFVTRKMCAAGIKYHKITWHTATLIHPGRDKKPK